jgi:hypothetical protein
MQGQPAHKPSHIRRWQSQPWAKGAPQGGASTADAEPGPACRGMEPTLQMLRHEAPILALLPGLATGDYAAAFPP